MDLARLASEAQASGEAYLAIVAGEGSRLGLEARWDGQLSLELEGQVRLLPASLAVDPASLGQVSARLCGIEALGFRLHHYGDGWVIATRPVDEEEVCAVIDAAMPLFQPEPINRRRA